MKRLLFLVPLLTICLSSCHRSDGNAQLPANVTLSKEVLLDKIKGGWAGQAIGCTLRRADRIQVRGKPDPGVCTNRLERYHNEIVVRKSPLAI